MKKPLISIVALSVVTLGASVVVAQTQGSEITAAQTAPEGEALQQSLREKAKRIPARNLAAALRAARDERDVRAQTVERRANLEELRADLARTAAEDQQRPSLRQQDFSSAQALTTARPAPPPPPGIRPLAASRLQNAEEQEVARVRIPVLIPADPAIRNRVKVYGMENVYTATAVIDAEASFTLSGTCNRVVGGDPDVVAFRKRLAEGPRRLTGAGAAYQISRNDFGVDLSFSKFGCGYVMTIECGDPAADPRCAQDDYVTGLADSMILANPELAGGE